LLAAYKSSPSKIVTTLYPRHQWLPWKFTSTARGWWADKTNQKQYFTWLAKTQGWKEYNDYYKLSQEVLHANYGA